jgi:hypothetical protein
MAMVMVGDQATAEDVVQDAFERLHRRWPRLRESVDSLPYYSGWGCYAESLGPSGVHALIWCLNSFGRLDGSHFTPLPGASKDLEVAIGAAW